MKKSQKEKRNEPRIYCKYCGAKLKKDYLGRYCPTENCQWQYGLPDEELTEKEKNKLENKKIGVFRTGESRENDTV